MKEITKKSPQYIDNLEHDEELGVKKVMNYESDGTSAITPVSKLVAEKTTIVTSGTTTTIYNGVAPMGTAQSAAGWQCKKTVIDGSVSGTKTLTKTWADGNANFDNVATDLTALTYS